MSLCDIQKVLEKRVEGHHTIPIHPLFEHHRTTVEDCIHHEKEELFALGYRTIGTYGFGKLAELLKDCNAHAKAHTQRTQPEIAIVHPWYLLFQHHQNLIDGGANVQEQATAYVRHLCAVLEHTRQNILLIDTPETYATMTAMVVERNPKINVIFSEFGSGDLLQKERDAPFIAQAQFFGGCYITRCVGATLSSSGKKDPIYIRELSPSPPNPENSWHYEGQNRKKMLDRQGTNIQELII